VVMLRTLSWTVPGTEDWVAWEAPWPFSLVRPEDMFSRLFGGVVIVVVLLSNVMRLRLIEMGRYLSVYLYLLIGTATYVAVAVVPSSLWTCYVGR
jgi:hypothetical protein